LQIDYSNLPSQDGLKDAEQAARKALKLEPDLAEAWAFLGAIAIEPEEAVRRLRRAIELSPSLAIAHLRLSNALENLGERDESLRHAERALQLDPLSTEINIDVGYTLDEMGRFEEAAARYRRAIEIDPQSPIAYMHLAFLHAYAWNRFAEAVPLIERAIELDTGNSSIAGVLAFVLLDMDEETRSAKAMADAMRNAPDGLLPNVYAAWYYSTLGDHAAAESSARKVVEVSPREFWSLSVLRNADLREGDLRAARARYASAFPEFLTLPKPRVDTGNVFPAIDFAYLLQQTGERELSLALLDGSEQAIRKMPPLGSYGFAYADFQIRAIRGDKTGALEALRKAAQAGWRSWWRYFRDFDPTLHSIRNEPEFKAVFADIERDMAKQRAALAARPKDAPLELKPTGA